MSRRLLIARGRSHAPCRMAVAVQEPSPAYPAFYRPPSECGPPTNGPCFKLFRAREAKSAAEGSYLSWQLVQCSAIVGDHSRCESPQPLSYLRRQWASRGSCMPVLYRKGSASVDDSFRASPSTMAARAVQWLSQGRRNVNVEACHSLTPPPLPVSTDVTRYRTVVHHVTREHKRRDHNGGRGRFRQRRNRAGQRSP